MNTVKLYIVVLMLSLSAPLGRADIYIWIAEDGVKHFTNYAPPAQAEIIQKTHEIPYDEEADLARREAEMQQALKRARQEIAEKQAELAERRLEAERRMMEANRKYEEILEQAESMLKASRSGDSDSYRAGFAYFYRLPCIRPHGCWPKYYRDNGGIFYQRHRPRPHPYSAVNKHRPDPHISRKDPRIRNPGHPGGRPHLTGARSGSARFHLQYKR
jgi:hypothetical protein